MTTTTFNPHPSDADQPLQLRRIRLSDQQPFPIVYQTRDELFHAPQIAVTSSPEELSVFELPATASTDTRQRVDAWIREMTPGISTPPIAVKARWGLIRWRPGRAVIECNTDHFEGLLRALSEFALLDSELRRLDIELSDIESHAHADVALSCRIQWRHRSQWDRLVQTTEQLSQLRLAFARLEWRRHVPPPMLTPAEHSAMSRLLRKANVPPRMEVVSNRLEACEDLYNGAVDRIAEFRGYRSGEWLEIIIIVLLALEVAVTVWHIRTS